MGTGDHPKRLPVRTVFLSDMHLGFKRSRAGELLEFLQRVEAECFVLAGDIIDALSLGRRFFWAQEHTRVLNALLAKRRAGARLIYIPGNHDASLAMLGEVLHGQVEVRREWVHRTARGERLLVVHGDQFEHALSCRPWLARLGSRAYDWALTFNHHTNTLRRLAGLPYCSLAERMKLALGVSARYIAGFEHAAAAHARAHGYDGVVCGHIHRAVMRRIDGALYCNTGDWVESCSALIEHTSGELRLWRWPHGVRRALQPLPEPVADAA